MFRLAPLLLLVVPVAADFTCRTGGTGPCIPYLPGYSVCQDGSACIVDPNNELNNSCCPLEDVVNINCAGSSTDSPPCMDKVNPQTGVSDCPRLAHLCDDLAYTKAMTEQCPKTCNKCPGDASHKDDRDAAVIVKTA